ncbi:SMI1/KNR4 family protein [Kitasatospora sp. NBC_00240]|uniref:SMI1/KNR4 family protein n=1 Tax=Kitasatospora sp. NBC_00240 TaxID=2903567 RepID=UPI00224FB7D5|nr:SMI1/KNR4 family protein [Kitasatospora sp. NBC_00240]MCX5213742.1 SMI1/KNR4 family protein [Kitasatospora sp. NBC_00240]
MKAEAEFCDSIFGMPLPRGLIESIQDLSWMALAGSPRLRETFGQAPVQPRFYSTAGIVATTKWWREDLDDETMECYFGTSEEFSAPEYMSRMKTVIIGSIGPDLLFALDYRDSFADPRVVFLGEEGAWRTVSNSFSDLLLMLGPERPDGGERLEARPPSGGS